MPKVTDQTNRYRNALRNSDFTIDQDWASYSPQEHDRWDRLFKRAQAILRERACDEFIAMTNVLQLSRSGIPDMEKLSDRLEKITGWRVVPVTDLVPDDIFFDHLANKRFPAGAFIRPEEEMDYLKEPDIFHDVFGHIPLLTNPAYADYMNEYGRIGLAAVENKGVKFLARLNWYTIEFGLIRKPEGIQIYGAGIVSSFGEAKYVVEDLSANQLAFALDRVLRTGYYIDDFQATYFVVDQFKDLFDLLKRTDFIALFDKLRALPAYTPFEILSQDAVIRKGTGRFWRDFPLTKTKLK